MGYLPSGLSMYSVLQTIAEEAKANNATVKAPRVLVELLSRVPPADVAALQQVYFELHECTCVCVCVCVCLSVCVFNISKPT